MTNTTRPVDRSTRKRRVSPSHKNVLFALSGNQCAHPQCTTTIVEAGTEFSEDVVTGHVCHIHAISEVGPRCTRELTEEELNSPENLILLCAYHHAVVDGQPETYPPETLKAWKRAHEEKLRNRDSAEAANVRTGTFARVFFPTELIDQAIEQAIERLRKSRLFREFDAVNAALSLGRRVVEGDLSGGSDDAKCRALAWCARLLAGSETIDIAQQFLGRARSLGTILEIDVAHAFIISRQGDRARSLRILADLDTPSSRSAALMIVVHHDDTEGGIKWIAESGIEAAELDSDGKSYLLVRQLELARWEEAHETLSAIEAEDLANTPILYHLVGIVRLLSVVPDEFRARVWKYVPFNMLELPLASDAAAMKARREASRHFYDAVEAARKLDLPEAANVSDEYTLWLELADPTRSAHGKRRVEERLRDPKTALAVVHLGLSLGIKLDTKKVERDIEREIARNGGLTTDAAFARFSLVFAQKTPAEAADYLARHHQQLATQIDKKVLLYRQIDMFAQAHLPEKAKRSLEQLIAEGISEDEEKQLRGLIDQARGADPIEQRKRQFESTGSLSDLIALVRELEAQQRWDEVCEYGKRLFDETNDLRDAEGLANALNHAHRSQALVEFLEANADLLPQSAGLRLSHAWGLFNEGALVECRAALEKLSKDVDSGLTRGLRVNLALALGDLGLLAAFVAEEYRYRDERTAHQLMEAAELALHAESPHGRELVLTAVEKAADDVEILAGAYFLATRGGWEDDQEVVQWLHRAAALSGEDGPLQRIRLRDVLSRQPEWDRRESESWGVLTRGECPLFVASGSLNRSLVDLTLFPALANRKQSDLRRRGTIPGFAANREAQRFSTDSTTIGVDATALLTLGFLGILDKVFDTFETVYVAHSTLAWLFRERQRARFHQPSRIENAHRIRDLLSTDMLEEFVPTGVPDSELSEQVGEALAGLIAAAEVVCEDECAQGLVVCPAPVHRPYSLMEEEADLASHASTMSSCLAVVEKLREKGQITAEEEKRARAYLQLQERPWPNQPQVRDGAVLYLDNVAMRHLLQLGMLGKLKGAGLRAVASPKEVSEANALIAYGHISKEVIATIERVRNALSTRIKSGRVYVDRRRNYDEVAAQPISEHPTIGLLALGSSCDAIVVDDRYVNRHAHIGNNGSVTPIFSSLDLLDTLESAGVISGDDRFEYRTRLRRAGYVFIPIDEDELTRHVKMSTVRGAGLIETAELKAIRESVLSARMRDWLQLPQEAPWLDGMVQGSIRVLRALWKDEGNIEEIRARSEWLAELADVRGWAHRMDPENADEFIRIGRGAIVMLFLTSSMNTRRERVDAYWEWAEEKILAPLKEQFPDVYEWILDQYQRQIADLAEAELGGVES